MSDELQRMLETIQSFHAAHQKSKRTILCEPHREHQVRAAIDQAGAADVLTVRASFACPEGQLLLIDEGAPEVQAQEWQQGLHVRGSSSRDRT